MTTDAFCPGCGCGRGWQHFDGCPFELELEVLAAAATGKTYLTIAEELHYSVRTIKYTVRRFCDRFNLSNRTEAVAHAIRQGWI